jgi:hypothetical protein
MAWSSFHQTEYNPAMGKPKQIPQPDLGYQGNSFSTNPAQNQSMWVSPNVGQSQNAFSGQNMLGGPNSHIGQYPQPGTMGNGTPSGGYTPSSPWAPSPGTLNPTSTVGSPWASSPPIPQAPRPQPTPGPAPGTVAPGPGGIPDLSGDFIKGFASGTRPELAGEAFKGIGKYYGMMNPYSAERAGDPEHGQGEEPNVRGSAQKEIQAAWKRYDSGELDENEFYDIFNTKNKNVYDKEIGAYNNAMKLKNESPFDYNRLNMLQNAGPMMAKY